MRRVTAIVIGLVIAVAVLFVFAIMTDQWFPFRPDLDPVSFADAPPTSVVTTAIGGQLLLTAGWFLAGLFAAFVALRISQWRPAGWIVGVPIVALGVWDLTHVEQPLWMQAMSVVAPLLGCWLAERHFHRARPGDPLIN